MDGARESSFSPSGVGINLDGGGIRAKKIPRRTRSVTKNAMIFVIFGFGSMFFKSIFSYYYVCKV